MHVPRKNPLRAALVQGRLVKGAFQLLSDGAATEIMLRAGLDFILIDAEHRPLNPETVERLVALAQGQGAGKSAMVRVPEISRGSLQYALETGADAVLAPLVGTPEQAAEVVSLCRYPPRGTRGLNAGMRAADWGVQDPGAYAREANAELVVAVQIETAEGLRNVEAIAAVEGLDMLYIGPFDLSHGMGLTGQLDHADVRAAITRICRAAQARGKWLGILAPDLPFARWGVELGVRFLTYRSDLRALKSAIVADVAALAELRV